MTLTSKTLAALVVTLFFGAVLGSSALGWWQTESTKEAAVFTSGEFTGQANPADIRGSYTFGDVERNFAVPAAILAEAFGVEDGDPAAFQVKELEEVYAGAEEEIGTASVRLFVALYSGRPYDLSADVYLPAAAAVLLQARSLDPEEAAYLAAHVLPAQEERPAADSASPVEADPAAPVSPDAVTPAPDLTTPAAETPGSSSQTPASAAVSPGGEDRQVKGKTTFAELLEWGLSKESVEKVLGLPFPAAAGTKVKDFCTENDLSFESVKPALQAEIDARE